ncbi:MAG: hypothetical protein A2Z21_00430 [Candidatus Fraserbacteria bacterium RBG_16_55_9]|uniref:CobQ/CobB/MinD/ParA nucleotide binding domain-containing protein n=1 Tax=Fraserbacteria sp. (strain RBG_16_55_9) TaxID=1817864 RepID=A0A1F5UTI3_FRAXR|nr:MAG: hypothetical protein A2Z21_00430 [Candidatus Fraserbacteria bacterium RBG_16_55_9]
MKIVLSGKGGVGKTTLCALLAREAASKGYRVLAVDADPNPTLAATFGLSEEPRPLVEFQGLIEERLGSLEGFFRLNPKVDDIPGRFAVRKDGVEILVMGPIRRGGEGCACPQSTFLKSLLQHIVLDRDDLVLLDVEAGLESLGRATVQGVDCLLAVVEPDSKSLLTAGRISRLAQDIGLKNIFAVANKIREPADSKYIQDHLPPELVLLGTLPDSEAIRRAGRERQSCDLTEDPAVHEGIKDLLKRLEAFHGMRRDHGCTCQKGKDDGTNLL